VHCCTGGPRGGVRGRNPDSRLECNGRVWNHWRNYCQSGKEKYNIVLPGDKVEKEEDEENEDEANAQKEESKETGEATEEASLSEAQAYAAAPSNYTEAPGNGAQAYAATPSNGIAPANGETVANGTAASAAS